jgi:hypothetical protein
MRSRRDLTECIRKDIFRLLCLPQRLTPEFWLLIRKPISQRRVVILKDGKEQVQRYFLE